MAQIDTPGVKTRNEIKNLREAAPSTVTSVASACRVTAFAPKRTKIHEKYDYPSSQL